MNRHTSNPFLSDWGDDDDDPDQNESGDKKTMVLASGVFSDDPQTTTTTKTNDHHKRLYHRNMSSFDDAASLQSEFQQQQQQLVQDDPSGDIIAKMTSEFQSAIETNDKDFGDQIFDPFETIVDDDVSLPSPALNARPESVLNDTTVSPNQPLTEDLQAINGDLQHGSDPDQDDHSLTKNTAKVNSNDENNDIKQVVETHPAKEDSPTKTAPNEPTVKTENSKENEPPKETTTCAAATTTTTTTIATTTISSAIARPRPVAANKLTQKLEYSPIITKPITPRRSAKQQAKKKITGSQEDSSDSSSDEDERIKIVIRTNENKQTNQLGQSDSQADQPKPILLLPPPPSKSSIIQAAREQADNDQDDFKSPFKVARRRKSSSSSESSSKRSEKDDAKSKRDDPNSATATAANEDKEDLEDDDGEGGNGEFVIPMTHSLDEEDYTRPDTPLYDEDTSYVLEDYPAKYEGSGWEMMLRYPPKKKLTSNRFWKKIFVKLAQVPLIPDPKVAAAQKKEKSDPQQQQQQQTCIALQIFDKPDDKKPMQEIPIQATYTVSEISSQQFDQFGKIFTIKLQYIFYKERVGVRQGQLARFIHSGHIGSSTTSGGHGVDPISIGAIKRIGAPIEHSPQISQIIKLGCTDYNEIKQFKNCLEDCLFKMPIHRDRALTTYKTEEVQMAVRDETYIEVNQVGQVTRQLARVRLFFLSFLNGMPTVEVGINEIHRQGREVVGRMDILPVVTEEWIRLEAWELHSTIDKDEFENPDSRIIKLIPPDATFFELMRFRIRPPRNRELPLQISANMSVTRTKVSINCDVMVPGSVSRKHGQIPCENIAIRIYMPECWIYFFREEKHFRMGSKKSVNRRPGKVKGIERFLGGGGAGTLQDIDGDSSLIEVTSGQAKYEHHHHAIVWRAARWPKESQSAYVQNNMKIRLPLTAYDKMPDSFCDYVHVEYTMPATTVSHTTLRSISVNPYEDEPAEKYVKYSAKYEYKVRMRSSVNIRNSNAEQNQQAQTINDQSTSPSPAAIMKQPDLNTDLQKEEDSDNDDDDEDDDDAENDADANNNDDDDEVEVNEVKNAENGPNSSEPTISGNDVPRPPPTNDSD